MENYRWQMDDGITVINQLLQKYSLEGIAMPYTIEKFRKEYVKAHLGDLDPEDRLKGLEAEDRLKGLEAEDRLKGLGAEEIEAYLNKLKKKKRH